MMALPLCQKLLIADDDKHTRELLADIFTRSGYSVRTSCDGADALRQFHSENPDLLITDLNMPQINGYDLGQKVRSISKIPIFVLTGSDLGDGRVSRTAFAAGANTVLGKPFSLEEILAQVEALLASSKALEDAQL